MRKSDGSLHEFVIAKPRTVIGRKPDADLRIPLSSVSREHCTIEIRGDEVYVRDLGSSNGTKHNGQKVHEGHLAAGDSVIVGPIHFIVVIDGQPSEISHEVASEEGAEAPTAAPVAAPVASPVRAAAPAAVAKGAIDPSIPLIALDDKPAAAAGGGARHTQDEDEPEVIEEAFDSEPDDEDDFVIADEDEEDDEIIVDWDEDESPPRRT